MTPCDLEQPRQRAQAVSRRELKNPVGHRKHADDRQFLRRRPGEVLVSFRFPAMCDEFDETERADAAPLEGGAVWLQESGTGDFELALHLTSLRQGYVGPPKRFARRRKVEATCRFLMRPSGVRRQCVELSGFRLSGFRLLDRRSLGEGG